jgi:UDP-2,3-diacylglucosamine pyrophosphatase LpxH
MKIFSDIHIFAPHAIQVDMLYNYDCIYIGDIYDIKNTPSDKLEIALGAQKNHDQKCKNLGIANIFGNHDLEKSGNLPEFYQLGTILFCHGFQICWDTDMIDRKLAIEPHGIGFLKSILVKSYSLLRAIVPAKLSQAKLQKAYDIAKSKGCTTIVFGHTHTQKIIDVVYNGVRIVNVPRGMTEIFF